LVQRLNEEGVKTIVMNFISGTYNLAYAKRDERYKSETYVLSYYFAQLP